MKSNNIRPFEGEKYRISGVSGVHTMFITFTLCTLLIWYCASFAICMDLGEFNLLLVFLLFLLIVGGAFPAYLLALLFIFFLNDKTFIEVDKDGIRGKGKASYLSYDDFSYTWDEISSISFLLNRIIIRKGDQTYNHALSFVFRRNAKFLSALHTFGGERLLSEKKIKTIQLIHKLIPVVIIAFGFIYTIGMLGHEHNKPFYYTTHDFVVVGDDTYAVGSMCQGSSTNDRPVVWKNGEIREIGPIGNFNSARIISEMGGDIYIVISVEREYILLKNNEPFINLAKCESYAEYQSMFAVDDTLYISEMHEKGIGKYNREDVVRVYKYVKGDTELQRVPNKYISDGLFEQITTHIIMGEHMFYRSIPKGKYSTEENPEFSYMKLSGSEIYLLGHGLSNVRCENGSKVDLSIWRYVEQDDTYSYECVY